MRSRTFPSLLAVGSALLLLAALAPCANANCPACIRFYDFEGPVGPGFVVNPGSHMPAIERGDLAPFALLFQNDNGTPYNVANLSAENGAILGSTNLPPGAAPNLVSLGLHASGQAHLNLVMTFLRWWESITSCRSASRAVAAEMVSNMFSFRCSTMQP
jgi:hypothetical protein